MEQSAQRTALSQSFDDGFSFGARLQLPSLGTKDFVVRMDAFGFAPRFATWKQANYNDTSIKVEIWRPPAAGNDTTAATKCFRVISAIGCRLRDACTAVSDGQLQLNLSAVP